MQKLLLVAAITLISTMGINASKAQDGTIVLRYAETAAPGEPDYEGALYFADLVKERTDGRVEVQLFHSGQLGSDKAITQAAIAGTIDMAKCSGGNFSEFSDALYFTDLPGLFRDLKHARAVWQSPIRDRISNKIQEETGLTVVMYDLDAGHPRELGNSKRPIRVPSDTVGLKMRSTGSPVEVALMKAWGTGAVPVAWSELYSALDQGVVDGYYVQPIQTYFTAKFHEVAKYYTMIGQSWVTSVKVLSPAARERLGEENVQILLQAGREAEVYKDELAGEKSDEAVAKLEEAGVEIVRPNEEELALWVEKSQSVWPILVGEGKAVPQDLVDEVVNTSD